MLEATLETIVILALGLAAIRRMRDLW